MWEKEGRGGKRKEKKRERREMWVEDRRRGREREEKRGRRG